MNTIPWIFVVLTVLFIVGIVFAVVAWKKRGELKPDYRAFFNIGIVWLPLGLVFCIAYQDWVFLILGIVFLVIGLANKNKWKKQEPVNSKKINLILFLSILMFVVLVLIAIFVIKNEKPQVVASSFDECVALGNPVMESYPEQCRSGDKTFARDIGNELEMAEIIKVNNPRPNSMITSPLLVEGEAVGNWFFEASALIELLDGNGNVLAKTNMMVSGNWMTTDFVNFSKEIEFSAPETDRGELILRADNPSGLPEFDKYLRIPIRFR